jgi:hypothetical protein
MLPELTVSRRRRRGGLMSRAIWSEQAEAELEALVPDPALRAWLRGEVEAALRYVTAHTADQGAEGGIMWRRVVTEEQRRKMEAGWLRDEDDDSARAWHYFVLYRWLAPAAFQVLAVRCVRQIAAWELRYGVLGRYASPPPALAACAGGCRTAGTCH